ncbi:MAG TPA: aquaporin [Ilumatobacteraceae bacterium]|nr:aquaporin [Ilumatobacteraceae bacterium]
MDPVRDPVRDPVIGGVSTTRLIAAEFAGTTIVMLGGPGLMVLGGGSIGTLEVALGFGLAMAIAIGVIGAVANPMLSMALYLARQITPREAVCDWIGQFLGAIFGAALIFGINDAERVPSAANGWDHSGYAELGSVLAAELVLSVVVVVVLLSAVSQRLSTGSVAAFTGAAYALAMLFLLGIDGGGINPARSVGSAIFADTDPNALGQVWAFIVVPVVGAFGGLVLWLLIDDSTIDDTVFDDTLVETASDTVTRDH